MAGIGRKKQNIASGVVLKIGDGGSPEQFHPIGESIDFGTPGFKGRVEELVRKVDGGKQLTTEDFWALTGTPVSARIMRIAESARDTLNRLRSEKKGSREHHAVVNRAVVEALQGLQSLAAPPPKELIELIAYQLHVSGKPRNSTKDGAKRWRAVRLLAENPAIADRAAARIVGTDHKTIRAWRENDDFRKAVHSQRETTSSLKAWEERKARSSRRKRTREVGDKPMAAASKNAQRPGPP